MEFVSIIDAANYMAEKGWRFCTAFMMRVPLGEVEHFFLAKEADSLEEAFDGLFVLGDENGPRKLIDSFRADN